MSMTQVRQLMLSLKLHGMAGIFEKTLEDARLRVQVGVQEGGVSSDENGLVEPKLNEQIEVSIANIKAILEEQHGLCVRKIFPHKEQPKSRIGQNGLVILHRLLRRSIALLEAGMSLIEQKNLIALALVARGHFETTGALAYLLKQFKRHYRGETTVEELDAAIYKLYFGSSYGDLPSGAAPLNVLSGIDAADDLIKIKDDEGKPVFRDWYDLLSQYCHPNYDGTAHHTMVCPDLSEVEFLDSGEAFRDSQGVILLLDTTGGYFIRFFNEALALLHEHEEVPEIEK